jgi:hypothetical protein
MKYVNDFFKEKILNYKTTDYGTAGDMVSMNKTSRLKINKKYVDMNGRLKNAYIFHICGAIRVERSMIKSKEIDPHIICRQGTIKVKQDKALFYKLFPQYK